MTDASRREAMKLTAAAGAAALGTAFFSGATALAQPARQQEVTFESINEKIEALNLQERDVRRLAANIDAEPVRAAIGDSICPVYQAIRGILVVLATSGLIPGSWKVAINAFVAAMDQICGP
jgi:hypothetical protein